MAACKDNDDVDDDRKACRIGLSVVSVEWSDAVSLPLHLPRWRGTLVNLVLHRL